MLSLFLFIEIKGGPLQATYTLEQFHFHWGKEEGRGGEHTVNGKAFDAELHFVHYNKSKYGSFEMAADKEDGLAVLGVLIKVGQEHRGMSQLTSLLGDVITSGSSRKVSVPLDIRDLLPDKLDEYYTYPGSLTTPGYFESVRWIVFKDIMEISRQQDNRDLFKKNSDTFSRNRDTFKNDRDLFTRNMSTFADDRNLFTSQAKLFSNNNNTFKDDADLFTALAQQQGLRNEYWIKGRLQSPIDVTSSAVRDIGVRGLEIGYDGEQLTRLYNTGNSVKIQTTTPHFIRSGPLLNTYYLEQFHFHWGETEGRGGEHTIGGSAFDAELHFVHYNQKYVSFNGAVNQPDGLAVLAVLIQVGNGDHKGMEQITSALPQVVKSGGSIPCRVNCQNLLPGMDK
ncbi:hypothetical protein FSP39_010561 [Pinctada imbricata]|uniref:carbonic anhydrase n=1 Tax=Pinctada imbricata TaxID=66713 RepID=A0AA88YWV3_PINIB|nr:hypothetical protein FSP39_010561 [Pinctada imbricata]